MKRHSNGRALSLALVVLSSCRETTPPKIDICVGDGFGGADCVLKDGSRAYISPMNLKNYWMTPQEDMKSFANWCYSTDLEYKAK